VLNEPRRVNRVLAKKSNIFFIDPAHLKPFALSIMLGLVVGQGFNLGLWATILLILWPFTTWLLVVGKKPQPYLAQYHRKQPRWRRHKVFHSDPFHKHKVALIRLVRR